MISSTSKTFNFRQQLQSLLFLVNSVLITQTSFAQQNLCENIFRLHQISSSLTYFQRLQTTPAIDFKNDYQYLQEYKRASQMGRVENVISPELDTRIYYAQTAPPDAKGNPQIVDPLSRAVFIFFHGSGTMQSSGKNFYGLMNTLSQLGYSAISADHPFHADGPNKESFYDVNYYMNWVHQIIQLATQSGKPVYLVGHSYGPDVISEYVYRYPFSVQGIVSLSPAGFNKILSDWYENYTAKMSFGGDVPSNTLAGQWAYHVSRQFIWKTGQYTDPTIINPQLKIRMLSGNREEYVPAPIGGSKKTPIGENTYDIGSAYKVFFKNATTTIEPGVGHYIFNHTDQNGANVVMRELLAIDGKSTTEENKLRGETGIIFDGRPPYEKMAVKYMSDRIFQSWVSSTYGRNALLRFYRNHDNVMADKMLGEYKIINEERQFDLTQKFLKFITTPENTSLAQQYSATILKVKKAGKADGGALLIFADYIENK